VIISQAAQATNLPLCPWSVLTAGYAAGAVATAQEEVAKLTVDDKNGKASTSAEEASASAEQPEKQPEEPAEEEPQEEAETEEDVAARRAVYEALAKEDTRTHMNVVFIGHVDAGKSTLGGQILCLMGGVDDRTIEKYQKEAKENNRETWYMAYVMDTNDEERAKGKTVEVGRAHFTTDCKRCGAAKAHAVGPCMLHAAGCHRRRR
jgi:hypothetical protein